MDINQMKKQETEQQEETIEFNWPEAFYLPTDGEERKKALERAIAEGLESEENEIRKEVLERRYGGQPGVDQFLAAWMNLMYYANVVRSGFMAKFHRKEMLKTQEMLCFDLVKKYGKKGEEVLFMELYHLIDFYIDICQRDKKYNGLILGLGTIKKEKMIEKIANDVYRVSYCISPVLDRMAEYDLLINAGTQCYYNRFPNQKENLERLIEQKA